MYSVFNFVTKPINHSFDGSGLYCGIMDHSMHVDFLREAKMKFCLSPNPAGDAHFQEDTEAGLSQPWPHISPIDFCSFDGTRKIHPS